MTGAGLKGGQKWFPFSVLTRRGKKIWDSGELGSVSDLVLNLLRDLGLHFLISETKLRLAHFFCKGPDGEYFRPVATPAPAAA